GIELMSPSIGGIQRIARNRLRSDRACAGRKRVRPRKQGPGIIEKRLSQLERPAALGPRKAADLLRENGIPAADDPVLAQGPPRDAESWLEVSIGWVRAHFAIDHLNGVHRI